MDLPTAPPEAPLCIACKQDEAWFDAARNIFSKFCSSECQAQQAKYDEAVLALKSVLNEVPALFSYSDIPPPPRCASCPQQGSQVFDYASKKYLQKCHFCLPPPTPPRSQVAVGAVLGQQQQQIFPNNNSLQNIAMMGGQLGQHQQQQQSPNLPRAAAARLGRQMGTINRQAQTAAPPSESASRAFINPSRVIGRGSLCCKEAVLSTPGDDLLSQSLSPFSSLFHSPFITIHKPGTLLFIRLRTS